MKSRGNANSKKTTRAAREELFGAMNSSKLNLENAKEELEEEA